MVTPTLKSPFHNKHIGNVTIENESFCLHGVIDGSVFVRNGGRFICHGVVIGDVHVDMNASAIIHGVVTGAVFGEGDVQIFGIVKQNK